VPLQSSTASATVLLSALLLLSYSSTHPPAAYNHRAMQALTIMAIGDSKARAPQLEGLKTRCSRCRWVTQHWVPAERAARWGRWQGAKQRHLQV